MGADSGQAKMPPEAEFSSRVKWKYADKAADFHRRHGYARYTMDFISTLETEMRDPELSKEHRALAAIKRYSWGNLSDFAVSGMPKIGPDDPEPRPLTQAELARGIGMSAATMSEACTVLRERFYVRSGVQDLYPEEQKAGTSFRSASQLSPSGSVNLAQESNSNSANGDSPFVRFRLAYLDAHPDVAREIGFHQAERDRHDEAAHKERDELRRMDREILGAFRDEERKRASAAKQRSAATSGPSCEDAPDGFDSPNNPDTVLRTPPADAPPPPSDSTDQSSETPEQELRTPQAAIQAPPTPEPPKPPNINDGSGEPLKTLREDLKYESPSSSSSPIRETTTMESFLEANEPDLTAIETAARQVCNPDTRFVPGLFDPRRAQADEDERREQDAASDSKSSVEAESIARAADNPESTTENLDGLMSEAAEQLRMARAASMHFGGVIEPEILEATPLPDRAITIEILEQFRGHPYEDFLFWLRDTVKRKLGVKSADRFRWGLYAADAKNQAPGIAKQRAAAAKACEIANERQQAADECQQAAEAENVAELDTPMPLIQAFGKIQVRLAGRGVPRALKTRLERTGDRISPNELERQIRGWNRCTHCDDRGTVGDAIDKTLAFCGCPAGIEASYSKGVEYPEREIGRVHSDAKSLLIAACHAVGRAFTADAIEESEVIDDGESIKIALPSKHFRIDEADVRLATERLKRQRRIVITGGRP